MTSIKQLTYIDQFCHKPVLFQYLSAWSPTLPWNSTTTHVGSNKESAQGQNWKQQHQTNIFKEVCIFVTGCDICGGGSKNLREGGQYQGCHPWECSAGGAMVPWRPQILADKLTLSQAEGADYAHQMILAPLALLCINKSNASTLSYSCNNITRGRCIKFVTGLSIINFCFRS